VVGSDRYETALSLAQRFPGTGSAVGVATGLSYADALAGGAHAARARGQLLLTPPQALPAPVIRHLRETSPGRRFVYGGPAAVSDPVIAELRRALS
jgi:hypothetical protein